MRKCILHAVWQAQGQGCAPGALGVCIGSDRAHGYELAKDQLFRTLDDVNPNPALAKLEAEIMEEANQLGVGAMGFGGKASLIGCKITAANRLPASFFVSVAYDCWAFRRLGVRLDAIDRRDHQVAVSRSRAGPWSAWPAEGFPLTGREVVLTRAADRSAVRALKVGDVVLINGEMFTGRDNVHAYLMKNPPPVDLHGAVLYHCGPVMLKEGERWTVKAAGPTTSIREEPYQADVIRRYGVRAVIGKGGMGAKTLAALKECGAVYLNAIGGAAQYYARTVEEVLGVHLMEFGIPEAMWHLRVHDFAAIVTMDAHGNSLHADVEKATAENWRARRPSSRACGSAASVTIADFRGQVAQSVERSPEKAGVGGSIPSLATMFSITYRHSIPGFGSNWFQFWPADSCLIASSVRHSPQLNSLLQIVRPNVYGSSSGFLHGSRRTAMVWVHEHAKKAK